MKKYGKILIVDDNEDILVSLRLLLKDYFEHIDCERNPNLIPAQLRRGGYDVYILEMNYKRGTHNGNEGLYWMSRILEYDPNATIVFITSYAGVDMVIKAIKGGASDLILKPWTNEKLVGTVLASWRLGKGEKRISAIKGHDRRKPREISIVGFSDPMIKLQKQISKVAATDANVLITGENGTGKELVARAIHWQSKRASEAFIHVDMGAVSESLFESELFGHKKGSFTDAQEDRAGRFESADRGTLFLDEIGNLTIVLQAKILSVLQNRQVQRLGTNTPIPVNIRLLSASNKPLDKMVREGKFREDLLYRLNTITINVPPLRERKGDVRVLFGHFKNVFEEKYSKKCLKVGPGVFKLLESWHWPGNVRELEHVVEKAVIMCDSGIISINDFLFHNKAGMIMEGKPECLNLENNEKRIIHQAIERCRGNLSQASRVLGITRKTLYNKISKYGI